MNKKQTIGGIYGEILGKIPISKQWEKPLTLEDVEVYSVRFSEKDARQFHFDLMMNDIDYLIYDVRPSNRVNVILRKGNADIIKAKELAIINNGTECQFYANDTI